MTDSRDPIEAALELLRHVPPPERQQEHRAAFLDEAHRVSTSPLMRLEHMNGRREEKPMTNRHLRRNLLLIAILIALFIAGGVLAQEIIDFFTQGEDDTTTIEYYPADSEFVTINPPSPIEEADFDVLMPTYIPEAYTFEAASFTPAGGSRLNYRCGDVWAFSIEQRQVAPDEIPDIRREVGASAVIETVEIGDSSGQYVRGHWLSFPSRAELSNATPGTPVSHPALWTNLSGWQQLVWYADGFLHKIATSGGITNSIAFPPCSLSKADYVAIANSLQPASTLRNTPTPTHAPQYSFNLDKVVDQVDFEVMFPTYIPNGYTFFSWQSFDTGWGVTYKCGGGDWMFSVSQRPTNAETLAEFLYGEVGASATIESVQIRDTVGQYVRGEWIVPALMPGRMSPPLIDEQGTPIPQTAVWTNESEWQALGWLEDGFIFYINVSRGRTNTIAPEPCRLDKDDFVAIANSLQLDSSLPE